ncbi:MAG: allantoin racemase [Acidimicrobiales bacterium]|jgi:allantoin racemase
MAAPRILVINPNSSVHVTDGIDRACEPLRSLGGATIDCFTNPEGPPGIETQAHVDTVARHNAALVAAHGDYDAYVLACYSDPGLAACREVTSKPVLGISESGILTALMVGHRFGVLAILATSIPRHLRYMGSLGVLDRLAGERPVGLGVVELADEDKTFDRLVSTGEALRDVDGADVLVMGCAGMADYRARLAEATGIPVVEPTQAAVAMAIGRVSLGW